MVQTFSALAARVGQKASLWRSAVRGVLALTMLSGAAGLLPQTAAALSTTLYRAPQAGLAYQLTIGPDGNVWTLEHVVAAGQSRPLRWAVDRLSSDGTFSSYDVGGNSRPDPGAIGTGADNNLWFGLQCCGIGRLATSGQLLSPTPFARVRTPAAFLAGPDGRTWALSSPVDGPGTIAAISSSGQVTRLLNFGRLGVSYCGGLAFSPISVGMTKVGRRVFVAYGNRCLYGGNAPASKIGGVGIAELMTNGHVRHLGMWFGMRVLDPWRGSLGPGRGAPSSHLLLATSSRSFWMTGQVAKRVCANGPSDNCQYPWDTSLVHFTTNHKPSVYRLQNGVNSASSLAATRDGSIWVLGRQQSSHGVLLRLSPAG